MKIYIVIVILIILLLLLIIITIIIVTQSVLKKFGNWNMLSIIQTISRKNNLQYDDKKKSLIYGQIKKMYNFNIPEKYFLRFYCWSKYHSLIIITLLNENIYYLIIRSWDSVVFNINTSPTCYVGHSITFEFNITMEQALN